MRVYQGMNRRLRDERIFASNQYIKVFRRQPFLRPEAEGGAESAKVRFVQQHTSLSASKTTGSYLEFCVVRHKSLEANTDTLDNTQKNSTHNSRVPSSLVTTTDSQRTTSEETSDNYSNQQLVKRTTSFSLNVQHEAIFRLQKE